MFLSLLPKKYSFSPRLNSMSIYFLYFLPSSFSASTEHDGHTDLNLVQACTRFSICSTELPETLGIKLVCKLDYSDEWNFLLKRASLFSLSSGHKCMIGNSLTSDGKTAKKNGTTWMNMGDMTVTYNSCSVTVPRTPALQMQSTLCC